MRAALTVSLITSLLAFTTPESFAAPIYSFSTAGTSGLSGPNQAQVTTAYSSTSLAGLVTVTTQGIQEWTVPATGDYYLEFAGASGGYTPNALGGKGRRIKVKVGLTAGNVIKILVGQEGGRVQFSSGYSAGGGGGTFLYNATSSSWIAVAGGGGGAAQGGGGYVSTQPGVDAALYNSTSGTVGTSYSGSWQAPQPAGTNGGAGAASSGGGSGAGVNASGSKGSYGGYGGTTFSAGGAGGANSSSAATTLNVEGGFGGGAGGGLNSGYEVDSGGGGGYSGGGAGATRIGAGGGGGNYFTGTYISNSTNTGHGFVTIQLALPPTVALTIAGSTKQVIKGQTIILTATVDDSVKITFYADGKRIPRCIALTAVAGNVTCNWKPTQQKSVSVYSEISQGGVVVARSAPFTVASTRRSGLR